jgi:hypothetical protein
MRIIIDDNTEHPSITIDTVYKLFKIENISGYDIFDYHTLRITINSSACELTETPSYYFVIDTMFHDTFSHWVYESAIYLPIFKTLKDQYKSIKLLLKGKKGYKTLFLDYFQIDPADITYELEPNNFCLFPSPISGMISQAPITEDYKTIFTRFVQIFHSYETKQQIHDYVFLPRQTKENYANDDRVYDMDFIFQFLETKNKYILNTDSVTDLNDQIIHVRSAPKVILTDGSAFLVNNMFCKNQTIYIIIDDLTEIQVRYYRKIKHIIEFISAFNNNVIKYIRRDVSLI